MLKFIKSLFSKNSSPEFSVEIKSSREPKTRWDEISEMDIPSSEKIKLVEIQSNPMADGETIEAERKSKRYTITVSPQAKDCFEYDESQKITVYVLAGSKEEAIDTLARKLSGKYGFSGDSNSNTATAGRWYDGNMYSLEIKSFEKAAK